MNVALLDKALARIDANPEEWNQTTWACGTTACLAGHIVLAAGEAPDMRALRSLSIHARHDGSFGAQDEEPVRW